MSEKAKSAVGEKARKLICAADVQVGTYLYCEQDNGLGHIHRVTATNYYYPDHEDGLRRLYPRKDKSKDAELGPEICFESHDKRICIPTTVTEMMELCTPEEIEEYLGKGKKK